MTSYRGSRVMNFSQLLGLSGSTPTCVLSMWTPLSMAELVHVGYA